MQGLGYIHAACRPTKHVEMYENVQREAVAAVKNIGQLPLPRCLSR